MSRSVSIPAICFTAIAIILQFEVSLSAPAIKSSPAINLISHFDSETGIVFPKGTEDKCKLSACNSTGSVNHVCGSDGKSYKNIQELECVRRSCHPDLKIQSEGKCSAEKDTSFREKKLYNPIALPGPSVVPSCKPDACGCADEFVPICGSDGVTYGNRCLLQCNRKCNPGVHDYHEGYCGRIFFQDSVHKVFQDSLVRQQPIEYTTLLL